jgi:hypothetical protein
VAVRQQVPVAVGVGPGNVSKSGQKLLPQQVAAALLNRFYALLNRALSRGCDGSKERIEGEELREDEAVFIWYAGGRSGGNNLRFPRYRANLRLHPGLLFAQISIGSNFGKSCEEKSARVSWTFFRVGSRACVGRESNREKFRRGVFSSRNVGA